MRMDYLFASTSLSDVLAAGTTTFWIFVAGYILASLVLVGFELKAWFFISLIAFAGVLQFVSGVNLPHLIYENWFTSLVVVGLFFCYGLFWSSLRWYLFCSKKITIYSELKEKYKESRGLDESNPEDIRKFKDWLESHYNTGRTGSEHDYYGSWWVKPKIRYNKSKWFFWFFACVPDSVCYLFKDFCKDIVVGIANYIYKGVSEWLQAMADRIWEKNKDNIVE